MVFKLPRSYELGAESELVFCLCLGLDAFIALRAGWQWWGRWTVVSHTPTQCSVSQKPAGGRHCAAATGAKSTWAEQSWTKTTVKAEHFYFWDRGWGGPRSLLTCVLTQVNGTSTRGILLFLLSRVSDVTPDVDLWKTERNTVIWTLAHRGTHGGGRCTRVGPVLRTTEASVCLSLCSCAPYPHPLHTYPHIPWKVFSIFLQTPTPSPKLVYFFCVFFKGFCQGWRHVNHNNYRFLFFSFFIWILTKLTPIFNLYCHSHYKMERSMQPWNMASVD